MKTILDPTFKYVKSTDTDIRKTFARARREMKLEQAKTTTAVVVPIVRKGKQ